MATKKMGLGKGLGKGIDALISSQYSEKKAEHTEMEMDSKRTEETEQEPKTAEQLVKMRLIEPNKSQPREQFNEDALQELADSIKNYGVIQPILLRKKGDFYEIIAGERRWRAAKLAGLKEIPAVIRDVSDKEISEISLIENIQRENLNPIEEAKAYQRLIQEYNLKQEEVAERVAKSRSVITNALRLLKLSDTVQLMLKEGLISSGHAKVLLGLTDATQQVIVAEKIVDDQMSVRETEKLVKKMLDEQAETETVKPVFSNEALYQKIETQMQSKTGTKVHIKRKGEEKGKIEIEYYSQEDLERIIDNLGIFSEA